MASGHFGGVGPGDMAVTITGYTKPFTEALWNAAVEFDRFTKAIEASTDLLQANLEAKFKTINENISKLLTPKINTKSIINRVNLLPIASTIGNKMTQAQTHIDNFTTVAALRFQQAFTIISGHVRDGMTDAIAAINDAKVPFSEFRTILRQTAGQAERLARALAAMGGYKIPKISGVGGGGGARPGLGAGGATIYTLESAELAITNMLNKAGATLGALRTNPAALKEFTRGVEYQQLIAGIKAGIQAVRSPRIKANVLETASKNPQFLMDLSRLAQIQQKLANVQMAARLGDVAALKEKKMLQMRQEDLMRQLFPGMAARKAKFGVEDKFRATRALLDPKMAPQMEALWKAEQKLSLLRKMTTGTDRALVEAEERVALMTKNMREQVRKSLGLTPEAAKLAGIGKALRVAQAAWGNPVAMAQMQQMAVLGAKLGNFKAIARDRALTPAEILARETARRDYKAARVAAAPWLGPIGRKKSAMDAQEQVVNALLNDKAMLAQHKRIVDAQRKLKAELALHKVTPSDIMANPALFAEHVKKAQAAMELSRRTHEAIRPRGWAGIKEAMGTPFSRVYLAQRAGPIGGMFIQNLKGGWGIGIAGIVQLVIGGMKTILWTIQNTTKIIMGIFSTLFSVVGSIVKAGWDAVVWVFDSALSIVTGVVRKAFGIIGGVIQRTMSYVRIAFYILPFVIGMALRKIATFEDSLTQVFTNLPTVGAEGLIQYRNVVLKILGTVPLKAEEINRALLDIVGTGYENINEASKLLEVSARTAVAGITTIKDATSVLITILRSYGMEIGEVDRISRVLFAAQRFGRLTFQEMASSLGRVAAQAGLANQSIEELATAFVVSTLGGLKARDTATSLRQLMLAFSNPLDKSRRMFERMGIAIAMTGKDGKETVRPLSELLPLMSKFSLKQLEIASRTARGLSALAIMVKNHERYAEVLAEINRGMDTVTPAYNRMFYSVGNQFKMVGNAIEYFVQKMGGVLKVPLVNWLSNTADKIKAWADYLAEPVNGMSRLERGIRSFLELIKPFLDAIDIWIQYFRELFKAAGGWDLVAKIIRWIGDAFLYVTVVITHFREVWNKLVDIIKTSDLGIIFELMFEHIVTVFKMLPSVLVGVFKDGFGFIFNWLQELFTDNIVMIGQALAQLYWDAGTLQIEALFQGMKAALNVGMPSMAGFIAEKLVGLFDIRIPRETLEAFMPNTLGLMEKYAPDFAKYITTPKDKNASGAAQIGKYVADFVKAQQEPELKLGIEFVKQHAQELFENTKNNVLKIVAGFKWPTKNAEFDFSKENIEKLKNLQKELYFLKEAMVGTGGLKDELGNVAGSIGKFIEELKNKTVAEIGESNSILKQILNLFPKRPEIAKANTYSQLLKAVMPVIVRDNLKAADAWRRDTIKLWRGAPDGPHPATRLGREHGILQFGAWLERDLRKTALPLLQKPGMTAEAKRDVILSLKNDVLKMPEIKSNKALADTVNRIFDGLAKEVVPELVALDENKKIEQSSNDKIQRIIGALSAAKNSVGLTADNMVQITSLIEALGNALNDEMLRTQELKERVAMIFKTIDAKLHSIGIEDSTIYDSRTRTSRTTGR